MSLSRYELYQELERKLVAELDAVRAQMEEFMPQATSSTPTKKDKKHPLKGEGIAKEEASWEAYVVEVLKELGGQAKTREVVEYVVKANPKLDEETVLDAVRGKLSKLYRAEVIGAQKSAVKSEGYVFHVK